MSDDYRLLGFVRARLRAIASGMRFGRFLSVGVVGFAVDTIVITILTAGFSVPTLWAKMVSAESSIIVMFVLNERWTFQRWGDAELLALVRRFLTSNVVRTGGVAIATAVLLALNGWFGIWVPIANAIGIGVGFLVNFVFESLLTWRVHTSHSGDN
ncbi:MAG: GtrA family protein [Halorientalis sp.]